MDVLPEEVVNVINYIENGEEPIMLKICSGTATEEEVDKWLEEQGIPIEEKEQVLSMMSNSFSAGGSLAEKMFPEVDNNQTEDKLCVKNGLKMGNIEPDTCECPTCSLVSSGNNNFPGCTKEDVINRLQLVLSEMDTIRKQVVTLIDQVNLLN